MANSLPNLGFGSWDGIVLFGLPSCPACDQASKFLQDRNKNFKKVRIDNIPGLAEWLVKVTGQQSAPVFFYNGAYVRGGWERMRALLDSGNVQ
jgi:glutaredoxin